MSTPARRFDQLRARLRTEGPQVLRIVVAAAVSFQICVWLGAPEPPIFAVVVPLMALRDHPYSAFNVSFDRLIGVIFGVVVGASVVTWLGLSLLAVMVVLAVGLLLGIVLRLGTVLNVQVALSGLLVVASADPGTYAFARVWETAVGAATSVLLSPFLFPPNALRAFQGELQQVIDRLIRHVDAVTTLLDQPPDGSAIGQLGDEVVATEESARRLPDTLAAAQRAVRLNPLRRSDREPLQRLAPTVKLVGELARTERLLIDEVADLSLRPHLQEQWPSMAASALRVLQPARAALFSLTRFETDSPADVDANRGQLETAEEEFERWKQSDVRPVSAVLRRPLRRLLDLLGGATANSPVPRG